MMADAARWYLEKNMTAGDDWQNTVAAAVWHGGALVDTGLDDVPTMSGNSSKDPTFPGTFDLNSHLIQD